MIDMLGLRLWADQEAICVGELQEAILAAVPVGERSVSAWNLKWPDFFPLGAVRHDDSPSPNTLQHGVALCPLLTGRTGLFFNTVAIQAAVPIEVEKGHWTAFHPVN